MNQKNVKYLLSGLFAGAVMFGATTAAAADAAPAAQQADQQQTDQQQNGLGSPSDMQVNKANSLDQLLEQVKERKVVESKQLAEREARFRRDKSQQQKMLQDAQKERTQEEQRSQRLETSFQENERKIGDLQDQLDSRLGSLRELFGVLQQVAGDTRGLFDGSVISAQYPNRGEWLGQFAQKMGTASNLATIDEMEHLWFELQREMTASGRVVKFPATVVMNNGQRVNTEVTRVGAFDLVTDDGYLKYDNGTIQQLARQPASRFAATAEDLADASHDQIVQFAIDPTRGSLLNLLIQGATLAEQVGTPWGGISSGRCYLPFCDGQGGYVGAVIILGGIFGVALAIWKFIQLTIVSGKVAAQKRSETPDEDNPLGRVLKVYQENRDTDVETLELKLGEAIIGETPKITSNITLIQVTAVLAPLLGLLGTVTGMIATFQAITLFGAGDPQTMASGISQALMTTVLGLVVAIPMTLFHSIVAQRSRSIVHVLEEQSAGIIADHAERSGQALG